MINKGTGTNGDRPNCAKSVIGVTNLKFGGGETGSLKKSAKHADSRITTTQISVSDFERKSQLTSIFKMYEINKKEKQLDVKYVNKLSRLLKQKDKNSQKKRKLEKQQTNNFSYLNINLSKQSILSHKLTNSNSNNKHYLNPTISNFAKNSNSHNNVLSKEDLEKINEERRTRSKNGSLNNNELNGYLSGRSRLQSFVKYREEDFSKKDESTSFEDIYDLNESIDSTASKLQDNQKNKIFAKLSSQYNFFSKPKVTSNLPDINIKPVELEKPKIKSLCKSYSVNRHNKIKLIDIYSYDKNKWVSKDTTVAVTLLNNLRSIDDNRQININRVNY